MERLVLANALGSIDFELLISDNVRSIRGYWGEVMEIRLGEGTVLAYIDENTCGFIKLYKVQSDEKTEEHPVTKDNLHEVMKNFIKKIRGAE